MAGWLGILIGSYSAEEFSFNSPAAVFTNDVLKDFDFCFFAIAFEAGYVNVVFASI